MNREIMIVTGEASGDLHGTNLVKSLQKIDPTLSFYGMGGPGLSNAGVEILFDASKVAVVGLLEVFSHLKDILKAQNVLRNALQQRRPDLLIIIDLPDFNLKLARKAKKLGIPVFYYISPQVWAWRSGRVKTIKKLIHTIGVILPFEKDFYHTHGVHAEYVGHPLLDSVKPTIDREQFCKVNELDTDRKLIGILPGSRVKEIKKLLPDFLQAADLITRSTRNEVTFLLPKAPTISTELLMESGLDRHGSQIDVRIIEEDRYSMMGACDVAIAASGTVTLELLLLDTPMVVAYKLSPVSYLVAKLVIDIPNFALVNLIAQEEIVPELLQGEVKPQSIAELVNEQLYDPLTIQKTQTSFIKVKEVLGESGASDKAARIAHSIISV